MTSETNHSVHIDVISDVMCPWCYIGQKYLHGAIKLLRVKGIDVDIAWHPFQLDPTIPAQGKDRSSYLNEKFGGPDRARQIYQRIEEAGKSAGIAFAFEKIALSPNTLNAHRVLRWARSAGDGVQDKLATLLFQGFFEEGADLGNHEILVQCAQNAGMNGGIVRDLLRTDRDEQAVHEEIATARANGVTGVPFFVINQKYALTGAQESETIANSIEKIIFQSA